MGIVVETVEHKIQNAILTAIDVFTPMIQLAVRAIIPCSGRDATSDSANSVRGEHIGITASFENVSEKNNEFHELNANGETRGNIPDDLGDILVSRTHFDQKSHTHRISRYCNKFILPNKNLLIKMLAFILLYSY